MLSVPILPPPGSRLRSAPLPLGLATPEEQGMVLLWAPTSLGRGEQCGAGDPHGFEAPPVRFGAATDQFWGGGLFFFRHAAADQHTGQ